jgi:hypothetical protein
MHYKNISAENHVGMEQIGQIVDVGEELIKDIMEQ